MSASAWVSELASRHLDANPRRRNTDGTFGKQIPDEQSAGHSALGRTQPTLAELGEVTVYRSEHGDDVLGDVEIAPSYDPVTGEKDGGAVAAATLMVSPRFLVPGDVDEADAERWLNDHWPEAQEFFEEHYEADLVDDGADEDVRVEFWTRVAGDKTVGDALDDLRDLTKVIDFHNDINGGFGHRPAGARFHDWLEERSDD